MQLQLDIFTEQRKPQRRRPYGGRAGYKQEAASKAAALSVDRAGKTAELRNRILQILRSTPMSVDQLAATMRLDKLYLRPRVAELAKSDPPYIIDSGKRTLNDAGTKKQTVWTINQ